MSYRTAEEIREEAIALIDARGSGMRTEAGEPIVDLIDAFSLHGAKLNVIARYLQDINSIAGWRTIIADETRKLELAEAMGISATTLNTDFARRLGAPLDMPSDVEAQIYVDLSRFAASQGRSRSLGSHATGAVTLYFQTGDPYTLARGATFKTPGNNGVLFDSTTDLIGSIPGFDASKNAYYLSVGIKARNRGRRGNQIIGAINQSLTPIAGVLSIKNLIATESGIDRESNATLLDALSAALTGANINTDQGIRNFLTSIPEVYDTIIVGPGDPLMERATAGAVDVYILGSTLQVDSVDVRVEVEEESVVLPYQPVRSITSVVGSVPYSDGGGYLTPDNPSAFDFSVRKATPDLVWEASPIGPIATEIVTVTFVHNALIRKLQRRFDEDPSLRVRGSSILFKEATQVPVFMEMKVIALPGFTQTQAENAVNSAINDEMSLLKLGVAVEYSDFITFATTTRIAGSLCVDRIDGFKIGLSDASLDVDNLSIALNEYARLDTINFIAP